MSQYRYLNSVMMGWWLEFMVYKNAEITMNYSLQIISSSNMGTHDDTTSCHCTIAVLPITLWKPSPLGR